MSPARGAEILRKELKRLVDGLSSEKLGKIELRVVLTLFDAATTDEFGRVLGAGDA